MTEAVVIAVALVAVTGLGVSQARRMTRLHQAAVDARGSDDLPQFPEIGRGARTAGVLRGLIALLTVTLLCLGAAMVS
jgi:hypothetical protein